MNVKDWSAYRCKEIQMPKPNVTGEGCREVSAVRKGIMVMLVCEKVSRMCMSWIMDKDNIKYLE